MRLLSWGFKANCSSHVVITFDYYVFHLRKKIKPVCDIYVRSIMKGFSFIKVQSAHNLHWMWPQLGQGCNVTGCTHAAKIT